MGFEPDRAAAAGGRRDAERVADGATRRVRLRGMPRRSRSGARRLLRRRKWLPVAALAAIAYVLGYLGYREEDEGHIEALYHALQLFALESEDIDHSVWYLVVASFAAPLSAGWAVVQAVFALFRDQLQVFWIRLRAGDHVVIAGLGSVGFGLATALDEAGASVVAIEADPANAAIASCRERGIAVVIGDAADPVLLRKTCVPRARHFVVTCGNDMTSLDVALATTRVVREPSSMTALVDLRDLALWQRLQAQVLMSSPLFHFRLDFFNVVDRGAEALLARHPPFPDAPVEQPWRPHVLFVGLEGVGEFALLRTVSRWANLERAAGSELHVTVVGPEAEQRVNGLLSRYPELADLCTLAIDEAPVSAARFQRGELAFRRDGAPALTAAYVCLLNETDGLTAALVLRGLPDTQSVPLVVTVWEEEKGVARLIHDRSGHLADVAEFGVLNRALAAGVSQLGVNEVLARLRHELYVRTELERGVGLRSNASMVPWDELAESLKESNRSFADGVGRKLAAFGCVVVPAPLASADQAADPFTADEIEELAQMEHDRWMRDLLQQRWRRTHGGKDAVRRLHPLLVPWEELAEVDRERDRTAIRSLAAMLARAGFELQRVAGPAADLQRAVPLHDEGSQIPSASSSRPSR